MPHFAYTGPLQPLYNDASSWPSVPRLAAEYGHAPGPPLHDLIASLYNLSAVYTLLHSRHCFSLYDKYIYVT